MMGVNFFICSACQHGWHKPVPQVFSRTGFTLLPVRWCDGLVVMGKRVFRCECECQK